jgi:hypothetical protein
MGVEGPASWKSGEGWDSTNPTSAALYQGTSLLVPQIAPIESGL